MQHVVPNKRLPFNVIITSSNIDRFSKFFHQLIRKIEINQSLKFSAQLKRVTHYLVKYRASKLKLKSPKSQKKIKVKLKVKSININYCVRGGHKPARCRQTHADAHNQRQG